MWSAPPFVAVISSAGFEPMPSKYDSPGFEVRKDVELERLKREAQSSANRSGESRAVFNLNKAGLRLLVIRAADSFAGENRLIAGPFEPAPVSED